MEMRESNKLGSPSPSKDNDKGRKKSFNIFDKAKKAANTDKTLAQFHNLLYHYINRSALPISTGTNPDLVNLLQFCVSNPHALARRKQDLRMGRYLYHRTQACSFARVVEMVRFITIHNRNFFLKQTKKRVPFWCVAHDNWDSKDNDITGAVLHGIIAQLWIPVSIPVMMRICPSKKAEDIANQVFHALERYFLF